MWLYSTTGARISIAVVALAAAGSVLLCFTHGINRNFALDAFVIPGDPDYQHFRAVSDEFTSNEFALIAVQTDDALSPESLAIVRSLVERVRPLPTVTQVLAITEIPGLAVLGDRLLDHPMIEGNLISADRRTAAIALPMDDQLSHSPTARRDTVLKLREFVQHARDQNPHARFVLAGPYVTHIDMYEYVDRDLINFSIAAFVLISVALWIVFGRVRPMIYAVGAALAALACTLGLAAALQLNLSLVVQMIVILVTVLTVANCVHLAVGVDEATVHAPQAGVFEHTRTAFAHLRWPCVAVIITTAVGFGSVMVSRISPVRIFGFLMVFGLLVGLAFSFLLLPVAGARRGVPRGARAVALRRWLRGAWRWARPRAVWLLIAFALITGLAIGGIARLRGESNFLESFRKGTGVRASYEFIEEYLSPLGSLEVIVRSTSGDSIVTPEALKAADWLAKDIVAVHEPVRKALTLADLLTLAGDGLPGNALSLRLRMTAARTLMGEDALRAFVNADGSALRINLRAVEGYNVEEKLRIAEQIKADAREAFGDSYDVEVTGLYYLYAKLTNSLIRDQYRSFGITVPAVFVATLLMLRNWRLATLSMLPNLLPVVWCLGAMGWTGIAVSTTTVMMVSVTFGIAVDDTLHYVWRFRREFTRAGSYNTALRRTHGSVGRACFFTTVVIAGGFSVLMLSRFLPTAHFGGLIAFTMCGALAADLLLLPLLMLLLRPMGRE